MPAEPEEQRHVLGFPVGPDPTRSRPRSTALPGGGAGGNLGPVDSAFFFRRGAPPAQLAALASPPPPGALRRGGWAGARLSSRHRRWTVTQDAHHHHPRRDHSGLLSNDEWIAEEARDLQDRLGVD